MPIKISKPPKGLTSLVLKHTKSIKALSRVKAQHLNASLPHKVYSLDPMEILAGHSLEKAKHVGWRIFHPRDKSAAIEAHCDEKGRNHTFAGINRGPFVQGTHQALDIASAHAALDEHSFELSMLRIPALYVMALWLKHKNSEEDIIISIPPTHHVIEPGRVYTSHEFWQRLYEAAKQRYDNHDAPTN